MNKNNPEFDLIIESNKSIAHYWKDAWKFRGLLYFLSWRDIIVRYKQTAVGISWSVLKPLITVTIFTLVFGYIAKLPDNGVPYPLLVFSALIPWQFFISSFSDAGNSLLANSGMINKVYFPRILLPASSVLVNLIDFLIALVMLIGLMIYFNYLPGIKMLLLPFFILLALTGAYGAGLLVAALNVKYRDFRIIIPLVAQFGLYISPVGFSSSIVPEKYRMLYSLNPMVGVIDGFRWAILGAENKINLQSILLSVIVSLLLLLAGIKYFRKAEKTFADII